MKSPSFTVVDKRGQAHIETPAPVEYKAEKIKVQSWTDVRYKLALQQLPNQILLMLGQAVGLRSDGELCIVNYLMGKYLTEHDWREVARKRLDTFLGCGCKMRIPCPVHRLQIQQWEHEDVLRVQMMETQALPPALEALQRAERAQVQTPKILVPR